MTRLALISQVLSILIGSVSVFSQDEPKPRVFVVQSDTWSFGRTKPGGGLIPDFLLGSRGGGSPRRSAAHSQRDVSTEAESALSESPDMHAAESPHFNLFVRTP